MGIGRHCSLAVISTAAAQTVISWPWVEDGLGDTEWQSLRNLAALGQNYREGLPAVTQYSWLADDLYEMAYTRDVRDEQITVAVESTRSSVSRVILALVTAS